MNAMLSVENVRKTYEKKVAVDDLSLQVKKGEIMGLLGPNGAGKTSLIRMIMDIMAPDSGQIEFSLASENQSSDWQNMVGYLPEERGLYQQAKVSDIFAFLGGLKGLSKKEAHRRGKDWLTKFELEDCFSLKIEELSKGMAQKVQFITSIMHDPELLILDEPFSGLDPVSQDVMIDEIAGLAEEKGMAIMLSSHRMNLVEELCDRIFFLDHGQEVLSGRLEDVKESYGNYRVKLNAVNGQKMERFIESSALVEKHRRDKHNWQLLLTAEAEPEQFMQALPTGMGVREISISRISLHDIFVRVARGGLLHEKVS